MATYPNRWVDQSYQNYTPLVCVDDQSSQPPHFPLNIEGGMASQCNGMIHHTIIQYTAACVYL